MARRNQNQFIKRKKEMEKKQKAMEKMAKRQNRKKQDDEPSMSPSSDLTDQPSEETRED